MSASCVRGPTHLCAATCVVCNAVQIAAVKGRGMTKLPRDRDRYLNNCPNKPPPGWDVWLANGGGNYFNPAFAGFV